MPGNDLSDGAPAVAGRFLVTRHADCGQQQGKAWRKCAKRHYCVNALCCGKYANVIKYRVTDADAETWKPDCSNAEMLGT